MNLCETVNDALTTDYKPGLDLDVAVIGGGVSGLYTAFRLTGGRSENETPFTGGDVEVFECADRIGGRLDSVRLPGLEIAGELGGMRYMPTQAVVATLIEDVFTDWLTHKPFPMGRPEDHLRYFRKQRFRANAWTQAQQQGTHFETRYQLSDENAGLSPDQLFNKIVYEVLNNDPWFVSNYGEKITHPDEYTWEFDLTRKEWNEVKADLTYEFPGPYEGMQVADMGFWNLIKDRTSQEGYEYLAAAGGYYSNTLNWNAAEAFPYMVGDFSKGNVKYRTIKGGYDLIAYALARAFIDGDGRIRTQNRLVTFQRTGPETDRRYELTLHNERQEVEWTAHADHVVLAMPRRSIELLDLPEFLDLERHDRLKRLVESVIIEPAYKLLMGFRSPWWRDQVGAKHGESITDLPMRQCYYFGKDPDDSHSLFLASYNDMRTVPFWTVLEDDARFEPRPTDRVSTDQLEREAPPQAPKVMVDEVLDQLCVLHGLNTENVPDPYVAVYKDWSTEPYGGGYHAWKAGVDVEAVMAAIRRPVSNEHVYVCGEAYSDRQGWVEGALCVAEKLLQTEFDLAWPAWLDTEYYLGW